MTRLGRVRILSSLTERKRGALSRVAVVKNYLPEAEIVHQGEKRVGFFRLIEGAALARRSGRLLRRLGPGGFFGEPVLFEDAPPTAGVFATAPSVCLAFSRREFWAFVSDRTLILRSIVEELAHRLADTDQALTD